MAVVNSSSFAKALWPGVNAWYGEVYNEYQTEYTDLFDKFTSRRQWEEDVGYSGAGLLVVKPEGAPIEYDSMRQGFTNRYTHVVYALGFNITREIMDDDQYDIVAPRKAKSLAFVARQTKEIIGANVYNRAFTAGFVGGDGVVMCSAAHPNIKGGTQSNTLAVAADISEASLEQATIDIAGFTNDAGQIIATRVKSLVIPRQLIYETRRILGSDQRVGGDLNDLNALKDMGVVPKVTVNHFLTDADAWFLRTDCKDGLKYFERDADEFAMDNDFDTENAKFKVRGRYSFGWTDWRGIYGSPGA